MRTAKLFQGDCRDLLKSLPERSVHCCVTSPPYYGLRDYKLPPTIWGGVPECPHAWGELTGMRRDGGTEASGLAGWGNGLRADSIRSKIESQKIEARPSLLCSLCGAWLGRLGLEPDLHLYVAHIVEVFREVRRVLRDNGTLWLNLGDSYASAGGAGLQGKSGQRFGRRHTQEPLLRHRSPGGPKPKSLMGVPWRVALALEADGWYLRSEIIYSKPAPMPESVRDRPTRSHEHIFLLSKRPTYFYDIEAVRAPISESVKKWPLKQFFNSGREEIGLPGAHPDRRGSATKRGFLEGGHGSAGHDGNGMRMPDKWSNPLGRNLRTVWEMGPEPCLEAHFATFPSAIPRTAILAGTSAVGCCAACGAPYVRAAARSFRPQADVGPERSVRGAGGTKGADPLNRWQGSRRGSTSSETTGWQPTCKCIDSGDPVPCTVLDPFMGSGRTGVAALDLGRSFVGIDLSRTYVETIAEPAIARALAQGIIGEDRSGLDLEMDGQQRGLFDADAGPEQ